MTPADILYVDHNATTPVRAEVTAVMQRALQGPGGNPASGHARGRGARALLEEARGQVAELLGARPGEIVFTASGTEAINLGITGAVRARAPRGGHVVVSSVEHHAVLESVDALSATDTTITRLRPDADGRIGEGALAAAMTPDTVLVAVQLGSNETGVIQDVPALAAVVHDRGALIHVDAVQGPGKVPVRVPDLGADLLSISAHKMYGPMGVGALFVRTGVTLDPLLRGGGHEGGRRSGTPNVPGAVGFGEACRLIRSEGTRAAEHLSDLTDRFESDLRSAFEDVIVHGEHAPRLPGTTCFSIPGTDAETLLIALDLEGICASSGAACTTGASAPSHVLGAMGVPLALARGAVRISFGRDHTPDDVDRLGRTLTAVVSRAYPEGART